MTHQTTAGKGIKFLPAAGIIGLAAAGGFLAKAMAQFLPVVKDVVSPYAWAIILVSSLAILLSFTPLKKIEAHGSNRIGYFIL